MPAADAIISRIRHQLDHDLETGDMFALFEHAREMLEQLPDDPSARYLQALAMARLGEPNAAMRLYDRNRVEEIGTEDAVALKGRLFKDLAVRAQGREQVELFRQASRAYDRAHELSDGYFSGINAATTSFLAGDEQRACRAEDAATGGAGPRGARGLDVGHDRHSTRGHASEDSSGRRGRHGGHQEHGLDPAATRGGVRRAQRPPQ